MKVLSITGDTELILGLEVSAKLDLDVNSKRRNCQVGQGGRSAILSDKNLCVLPLPPTARGHTKLEAHRSKMGNREIEVLAARPDCGGDSDVIKCRNQNNQE